MTEQELLQMGIGRRLVFLGHAADMVLVSLSSTEDCPYQYDIHISANCEISKNDKLLTSTSDIFEVAETADDSDKNLFVEKAKRLLSTDEIYILQSISFDSQRCLYAQFSGGLEIRSLPDLDGEEGELWRVFFPWKAEPHLIATQAEISLEQFNYSQEELDRKKESWSKRRENRKREKRVNQGTDNANISDSG